MAETALTPKELKEGKNIRILAGNLLALREIDESPNSAIARMLEENKQLRAQIETLSKMPPGGTGAAIDPEAIRSIVNDCLKIPVDNLMKRTFTAEQIGNIMHGKLNEILEPFMEH
ncbi:MAG: hypothetical protein ABR999_10825 [Methanoregula sp.]|jgi:plasmid stabilization system protein ParE|uniref:hypothetical protein n=1 Tax=Methanoregula sp. TaxID=2052170 RepID=UPI003D09EAEE